MEPTPKSPLIVEQLEKLTGRKRTGDICMLCGSDAMKPEDFRNDISRREARISCMCQECQNAAFGIEEEKD